MLLGYARVSTDEQETHLQIDALEAAGAERIYQEKASGAKTDRPELRVCQEIVESGSCTGCGIHFVDRMPYLE